LSVVVNTGTHTDKNCVICPSLHFPGFGAGASGAVVKLSAASKSKQTGSVAASDASKVCASEFETSLFCEASDVLDGAALSSPLEHAATANTKLPKMTVAPNAIRLRFMSITMTQK
jgi:hypothetical protein